MSSVWEATLGQQMLQHERRNGHVPKLPGDVKGPTSKTADMIGIMLAVMGESPMTTRQMANVLGWRTDSTRYYAQQAVRRKQIVMMGRSHDTTYRKVTP